MTRWGRMSIPLDSDLMRTFLAMAETGSVTAVAERVGWTQSAVSMQLKRLEEATGQRLFDRLPRGLALTGRGAQLLPYARRTVQVLEEAAAALREHPLESVLPQALAAFAERHPAVEVAVRWRLFRAAAGRPCGGGAGSGLVYASGRHTQGEVLCIDPTVWVTSVAHAQHLRSPLPVASYPGLFMTQMFYAGGNGIRG